MNGAFCAALFAALAWGGVAAGEALCVGRTPQPDGPRPIAFAFWPFPLLGAAIGLALALHGAAPPRLAVVAFAVFGLAGCAAADLACGMLPDLLTLAPLALALGATLIVHDPAPLWSAALVALPFAVVAAFTRGRAMGWGDVKLAALAGALLGAPNALLALMLAGLAAYAATRRARHARQPIAFGPYLAAAIAGALALAPSG